MTKATEPTDLKFGGPADYRIVVQGPLSEDWSGRLSGMSIRCEQAGDAKPRTTLVGPLRDQTELNGVLETLYSLHLSILRVEKLEQNEEAAEEKREHDGR